MNVNDTEIARGILKKAGYLITEDISQVVIQIIDLIKFHHVRTYVIYIYGLLL